MNAQVRYLHTVIRMLEDVIDQQSDTLEKAARKIADSVGSGGMLYVFGTGHAHILAEEIFYRAGGMAQVYPILDERLMLHVSAGESTEWERREGLARDLLAAYPVRAGDVLIVASNSGRNAAPVDMALAAKEMGVFVIGLTNLRHSQSAEPRNASGKRLFEVCDLVIDNGGEIGDAALNIDGAVGATSTAVGAAILQAITCRVKELARAEGKPMDFFVSSNVDGGDAVNEGWIRKYRPVVRCL